MRSPSRQASSAWERSSSRIRSCSFIGGIALGRKYPITENQRPASLRSILDILMDAPDGPIRIFGVHPPTPIFTFDGWDADLETIGELGSTATEPTLIVGDFNASYWHPAFRDLLRPSIIQL